MTRIFISYRRADSAGYAGRLYDYLAAAFGSQQVFMDIDAISPGEDFVHRIHSALGSCDVVIVLIGPQWTTVTGADGRRRLDDPGDYVRLEIANALARRGMSVIPVLVNDAHMPGLGDLPDDLKSLSRRNAIELSNERFRYDVDRLIRSLGGRSVRTPVPQPRDFQPPVAQGVAQPPVYAPAPRKGAGRGYNLRVWVFLLAVMALYAWISGEFYASMDSSARSSVYGMEIMGLDILGFNALFVLSGVLLVLTLFWPIDFLLGAVIAFVAGVAHTAYIDYVYQDVEGYSSESWIIYLVFGAIYAGGTGLMLLLSRGIRRMFSR